MNRFGLVTTIVLFALVLAIMGSMWGLGAALATDLAILVSAVGMVIAICASIARGALSRVQAETPYW